MTAAEMKMPACGAGKEQGNSLYNNSIPELDHKINNTNSGEIPTWMASKVTKLARAKAQSEGCSPATALDTLTGEAFTTLAAELAAFPELLQVLPKQLGKNIMAGAFSALSAYELAAIVIANADAEAVAAVAGADDLAEFTALKFQALAGLLGAGDGL